MNTCQLKACNKPSSQILFNFFSSSLSYIAPNTLYISSRIERLFSLALLSCTGCPRDLVEKKVRLTIDIVIDNAEVKYLRRETPRVSSAHTNATVTVRYVNLLFLFLFLSVAAFHWYVVSALPLLPRKYFNRLNEFTCVQVVTFDSSFLGNLNSDFWYWTVCGKDSDICVCSVYCKHLLNKKALSSLVLGDFFELAES